MDQIIYGTRGSYLQVSVSFTDIFTGLQYINSSIPLSLCAIVPHAVNVEICHFEELFHTVTHVDKIICQDAVNNNNGDLGEDQL
jgi:hypothetical protein